MKKFVYKYVTGHVFQNGVLRNVWEAKEFKTQRDLFDYLVTNKAEIIDQKKSVEKHCEGGIGFMLQPDSEAIKQWTDKNKPLYENDKEAGVLKRTVLANTYWWMDSMADVHLGRTDSRETAVFSNTIKQKGTKIVPIDQHNWSLDGRIGKTLNIYESPISWRALGVGKTGMTEGLFADASIERVKNEARYNDYLNGEIDQHSVGMQYVTLDLAVNDPDEYPKEYATYAKYLPKIGNRNEVEERGYFFAVAEAKLKEYSPVIAGANELTPVIGQPQSTGKNDPPNGSQSKEDYRREISKLLLTTM